MSDAERMATLRVQLVEARHDLRLLEDIYEQAKVARELVALRTAEAADLKLPNEDARKRYLAHYLAQNTDFQRVRSSLRECQRQVEMIQARLDGMQDRRRERELALKERALGAGLTAE